MVLPKGRIAVAGLALTLLLGAGGCARTIEHKGYIADEVLVSGIQPGVDNRDSVTATLGRPTFTGQFDQRDWYYVSRTTRQLAFTMPRPIQQTVVHIRFDEQGNVATIERTGLEKVASISPMDDKTPTLGRDSSFFKELFRGVTPTGVGGTGGTGQ
jgi:outer membrane protein assembly factor BamE (lipoprotein component of BamABCDE complex)